MPQMNKIAFCSQPSLQVLVVDNVGECSAPEPHRFYVRVMAQRKSGFRPSRWSCPSCSRLGANVQHFHLAEMRRHQTTVQLSITHPVMCRVESALGPFTSFFAFRWFCDAHRHQHSDSPLCFSAISNLVALGGTTNPLTSLCGISF